ncbi:hypothetical protein [Marinomonas rhodophyticola]|uniref:Uncharacterized protein n=1 Tax=Marinomonas rhodophyticola TaxID=2992803 RepID=A0ABT3KB95_9GAMM|nr:hypothetical protein [Marinomonas sp. KJ51-3]MCW4627800.1 hypothetical protein [Marinomonas sp. KJ51-3]
MDISIILISMYVIESVHLLFQPKYEATSLPHGDTKELIRVLASF